MEKDTTQQNTDHVVAPGTPVVASTAPHAEGASRTTDSRAPQGPHAGGQRDFQKNTRRPQRRESKVKPEFDQKIISIRRVTRVVTGGRRFSFSVALVAGNKKGSVGVGIGKAGDTSLAIDKALRDAKRNLVKINLTKEMSIPHEVDAKYCSARVHMMPAPGRGVIAGSSVRNVVELAGIKNISAKLFSRSKNKLNNARVAIKALEALRPAREKVAAVAVAVK